MIRFSRPARRLMVAAVTLLVVDRLEPGVRHRLEASRYEDRSRDFRFENSDLFGVGPLVDYLREHPQGQQPRVMFLGNSVTYGYGLQAAEAIPGQYQRLFREKVLNVGVNFFDVASAYLVAKATIDAVDHVYVLSRTDVLTTPLVARRIPVDDEDARRFGLPPLDPIETPLQEAAKSWKLYRDSYRLQAAIFGTSSRQYLYLHKGDLVRSLLPVVRAQTTTPSGSAEATAAAPVAAGMPGADRLDAIRRQSPELLWNFAELFQRRGKRVAFLHVAAFSEWLRDGAAVADFNRAFFPHARVIVLDLPERLLADTIHLNATGAASAARALWTERIAFEAAAR